MTPNPPPLSEANVRDLQIELLKSVRPRITGMRQSRQETPLTLVDLEYIQISPPWSKTVVFTPHGLDVTYQLAQRKYVLSMPFDGSVLCWYVADLHAERCFETHLSPTVERTVQLLKALMIPVEGYDDDPKAKRNWKAAPQPPQKGIPHASRRR